MRKKFAKLKEKIPARFVSQWRRLLMISALFAATFFMTGFFERYHLPKIKRWVLSEVEKQSQKRSPVRIWPQNVELRWLPLGATFYDVRVLPKPEMKEALAPTTIKRVEVSISIWSLFRGRLGFSRVSLEEGLLQLNFAKLKMPATSKSKIKSAEGDNPIEILDAIPIEKLNFSDMQIELLNVAESEMLRIKNLNFLLENSFRTLRAEIKADDIEYLYKRGTPPVHGRVSTAFLLDTEGLFVTEFKVEHGSSEVHATGTIRGELLKKKYNDLFFKIAGHANSQDVIGLKSLIPLLKNLPRTTGVVQFESDLKMNATQKYRAEYALKTENFSMSHYRIGDATALGTIDNSTITLTKLTAQSDYGKIRLNDFVLDQEEPMKFSGQVSSDGLKLRELLVAIGLKRIPVQAIFNGLLPCEGQVKEFRLTCKGQLNGQTFAVEGAEHPLVAFKNYGVDGEVTVSTKNVTYKTNLRIGQSKGESTGVVDYDKGFKIDYVSPKFNFSDIDELANLKPEGQVALKGFTSGNSQAAIIQMQVSGENLWLKDFGGGRAQAQMSYSKGKLNFKKLEGQIGRTRYNGDLNINLNSGTLHFEGASPYLEAEDVMAAFVRKVKLPFQFTGTGSADVIVQGPFDFAHLSYDLHSSLFRGAVADEPYDQIHFDVTSDKGLVKSNRIEISRGASRISAYGQVNPEGQIEMNVAGRNFQVEQFENLNRLKLNLTGNLNFDMRLTKFILKPDVHFKSTVSRMTVDDIPAQDSALEFKITESEISGQGQFLGPALKANFKRNLSTGGTTEVAVDVNNWDFTQMFSIFTDTLREGNYHTQLTGSLNMSFPNSNWSLYSGTITVKQFDARNGSVEMKTVKPISLNAKAGVLTAQDFEILGPDTFLRLKTRSDTSQELNLTLEGRVNLALAAILTPFLDDIRGETSFSLNLTGDYKNPQLNGSAFLEDGFFKIKGFPHSFEEVSSDANINNGKILINTVKGKIGGGHLQGRGQLEIIGAGSVPVDIKGEISDARINVPEGFFTRGDGDFFVKGNWFPYTVGVNYNIAAGSVEKKSSEFSKSQNEVKPSAFLPKFLVAQRFTPILLELNVAIPKPLPVHLTINRIDIQSSVYGHMQVTGPPDRPLLNGKVTALKGGKVTFRNNIFEIKGGYVEYNNSPPDDPTLNMQADAVVRAQLRDGRTRDYDVDLLVQGTAKNPKITMSSSPPLPENELISLLTLGFINEESTTDTGEATAGEKLTNTSYQLGSAFLNEQLGINRVLEKNLGLHFDFNSSYDTSDKAERHKFTLSKQWTPKFGTTASREIGKTNSNNVKAEYKLDKNLSVIGQWEGTEATGSEQVTTSDKDLNVFGLDIEFKVDFK